MRRLILFVAPLVLATTVHGYSVLTHEAIIDSSWDSDLKPLLLRRFPNSTPEELREAHAHAYGGSIIQDMGYYPFGSRFFSDLVHYVRSGDFVVALLKESQTRNEYAFALGALAHYAADTMGHSMAVNRAVALEFPKLKQKYGEVVTYYQKPSAHVRVEFSFDVMQVARGNYAPQAYRDFIGFEISKDVLERAFHDVYSMELSDSFANLDLALGTYRRAVSVVIPKMTKVAWSIKEKQIEKAERRAARSRFVYELSRSSYRKEWKGPHREPGVGTRILAFVIDKLPKIGPLKALAFRAPSPESDKLFQISFTKTLDDYRELLSAHRGNNLRLVNRDFDTGALTQPGEYPMADEAYATLVRKLADQKPLAVDPALRSDILSFFSNLDRPFAVKKEPKQWQATLDALEKLKSPNVAAMPY